ncbi:MAG: Sec-independent protein translocase protein TatB [Gammaproteobacteria bacterium]|nr:Sec-independent protein translocase protein TatB [Gammaproteobacteria bacterium]
MFDIGFWEICLIGIVALVVVGPDRFPGMIRSVGYWMGRFRQIASNVKNEIQTEVDKAEQLRELLSEQEQILKRQLENETNELQGISPAAQKAAQTSNAMLDSDKPLVNDHVEARTESSKELDKSVNEQKPNG